MSDDAAPQQPQQPQGRQRAQISAEVELVDDAGDRQSGISEPGKLMRIALMLREMQEEVRRADTDEAGRQRLRQIHDRSLNEMKEVLSGDLQEELSTLTLPFETDTPTESEIRIAQAQLIGWLEGLFQGIQAAIFSQQLQARQQLEQIRQRSLPAGMQPGGQQSPDRRGRPPGTGQYL